MSPERRVDQPSHKNQTPPDVYRLFSGQPEVLGRINEAEALLRQVERGEILFDKVREFLDISGTRMILTTPHPQLDNLTPMAILRQKAKQEIQEHEKITHPIIESPKSLTQPPRNEPKRRTDDRPQASQRPGSGTTIYERPSLEKGAVIRENADLSIVRENTEFVHLTHQGVMNSRSIRELLKNAPQLKAIEVTKSHARLIGPATKKILDQHGITILIGRLHHMDYYDEPSEALAGYSDKKKFWGTTVADPEKSAILDRLKEYEFEEVEMVDMYLNKKPRQRRSSIRQIADEFGLPYYSAQRRISGLLCFLGMEYRNADTQARARRISFVFNRLEAARESREGQEELRRSFGVEDKLPAQTLKPSRWEKWQQLFLLNQSNPELFDQLKEAGPRQHATLIRYFQLDDSNIGETSMAKLGRQEFGVTREMVRQYKNQALDFLGLLEE